MFFERDSFVLYLFRSMSSTGLSVKEKKCVSSVPWWLEVIQYP
jgi:hypothetical protein